MATLTNTKIKDTYVGLLKTTDNQAIDASGVTLVEDGAGNASALSVGRSGNGVTITGNVGLGTTPSFAGGSGLEIERAGIATLRLQDTSNVANAELQSGEYGLHIRVGGNGSTGDLFNVSSSGSSRLLIDNIGNVGIGTSSPSEKLDVVGRVQAERFRTTSAGDAGFAAYYMQGDANTGLFSPAADNIGFTTAGSERMRIDSSGRVGINTSSPASNLHILSSFSTSTVGIESTHPSGIPILDLKGAASSQIRYIDETGTIQTRMDFTDNGEVSFVDVAGSGSTRMRIDSSGNVGIGTSPTVRLHAAATSANSDVAIFSSASNPTRGLKVSTFFQSVSDAGVSLDAQNASGTFVFKTAGSERMRITSGGEAIFNRSSYTDGEYNISVNGTNGLIKIGSSITTSSAKIYFTNPNGVVGGIITSGTSTAYNTSSDYRLKENVVEMTGALDRVDALKPSRFNFIADPNTTVDGFLAHEVAEIVPEAVTGEKDATEEYEVTPAVLDEDGNVIEEAVMGTRPVYQGIDQSKIVPLLVGAIKELRAEIELLKAK